MTLYTLKRLIEEAIESDPDAENSEVAVVLNQRYTPLLYSVADGHEIGELVESKRQRLKREGEPTEDVVIDPEYDGVSLVLVINNQLGYAGYGPWSREA